MHPEDKQRFKEMLLEKRHMLLQSISQMEESALKGAHGHSRSNSTHMADVSADVFEQHLTIGLMENESRVIQKINAALERIDDINYGACMECKKDIGLQRLQHVPYARLCISCQEEEERREEGYGGYYY